MLGISIIVICFIFYNKKSLRLYLDIRKGAKMGEGNGNGRKEVIGKKYGRYN